MSDQSNRQAPLGENQLIVLEYLKEGRGWPGQGWTFDNSSKTRKILDSLVRRGLVEIQEMPRRGGGGTYPFYTLKQS